MFIKGLRILNLQNLENLNKTELTELIKIQTGMRISPSSTDDELIAIATTGEIKNLAASNSTRKRLQIFIDKHKEAYQANLPCAGKINEGKCTVYKCSEIRHIDCWNNLKEKINS